MTQAVTEFFLSEDIENFAIKNDDSSLIAKPLWVRVERQGAFHLALALSVGQTARGPLMQFYRDMSMSCELSSTIDEKNAEGFSFKAFFEPEDGAARIILLEAPVNCNNGESNFSLDLSVLRNRRGHLGLRCFSPSGRRGHLDLRCFSARGRRDLGSKLAVVKWVAGPNERISLLAARRYRSRRIQTTLKQFNVAYDHPMYASRKANEGGEGVSSLKLLQKPSSGSRRKSDDPIKAESLLNLPSATVTEGDNVCGYAHRVLSSLIPIPRPNFPKRIRAVH